LNRAVVESCIEEIMMQVTQQSDWSVKEAAGVRLGDKRFERVAAEVLEAQFNQNGRSFSGACGNALRQAAGRMLRRRKVTPMHLLAGHQQATLERCMEEKLIVIAQDSSSYNYSGHLSNSGLGSINNMKNVSGIHQHSALAMTEGALPLGVVHAKFWVRTGKKKSQWQRLKELLIEKESYKWLETSERLQELFAPLLCRSGTRDFGGRS
jgi:diaminopimelate epimerase